MLLKHLALAAITLAFLSFDSTTFAQRGGRGGGGFGGGGARGGGFGGGERGGGGGFGGPGAERGGGGGRDLDGGFGGGLSPRGDAGRSPGASAAMGPFGHEGSGPHDFGGAGGPASGIGVRPGMGAGGAGGPASGIGVRPGMGAGGAGGPASGIGVRPGMGAGGAGGPASGIGVRPGMGAGEIGTPDNYAARAAAGTYYNSSASLAAQSAAFRSAAGTYPAYGAAMYAGYPRAWVPNNVNNVSVYTNPGYGAVAGMIGLAATPMPYDYGSNVVAQPTAVYVNGDGAGTPQEYAAQASQLAGTGQSATPDADSTWLPLGVFAIVQGDATNSDDTFQLAVNPQGVIRGNYHNLPSNDIEPVAGAVDKTTQRAAWRIGMDNYPVYEAGIANLTKEATPLLIHPGEGQAPRQLKLIRLPSPQ